MPEQSARPSLSLHNLNGMSPEERVKAMAELYERLTGNKPTQAELDEALAEFSKESPDF